jgi:hypothetical protein
VVSACNHAPVATSSVLTYIICDALHAGVEKKTAWLAVLGVFGDLGAATKLGPPYPPALAAAKNKYRATHLLSLTVLMKAPAGRRSATPAMRGGCCSTLPTPRARRRRSGSWTARWMRPGSRG